MTSPTETGLYPGVSWETYRRIDRANWSTVKHLRQSPAHYHAALTQPEEDKDSYRMGRATHMAALEPEKFRASWAVPREGIRRGTKEWLAFCEKHPGCDILKAEEFEEVQAMATAARSNEYAAKYLRGGQAEVALLWTHEGGGFQGVPRFQIECKGRVDFAASCGAIVDLKTTRDASPDGFARLLWNYGYHVQAAFYVDGYRAATGKLLPYVIVAVESSAPHVVQTYRVPERVLDAGREVYRGLLEQLAECRRENRWLGYADGVLDLTLPAWAQASNDEEEDITGLGLVVNQ